jgi:hypothetical protein
MCIAKPSKIPVMHGIGELPGMSRDFRVLSNNSGWRIILNILKLFKNSEFKLSLTLPDLLRLEFFMSKILVQEIVGKRKI